MIDDTVVGSGSTSQHRIHFSTKIEDISKHRTDRRHATHWARNLRFLTFDDGLTADRRDRPIVSPSTTPPVSGQCARCKLRVPPAAGHICSSHFRIGDKEMTKEREKRLKEYSDPCVHVEDASCSDCRHIPLFPTDSRAVEFRIRRLRAKDAKPSELSFCTHFVAVSYCWPPEGAQRSWGKPGEAPYSVLEEDGKTVRHARAPKSVIDRAVDFAVQNGLRMIWIDQECIEQDKEDEKEVAVNAMDMVYLRAHTSIGLFDTKFHDQRHLDALFLFFELTIGLSLQRRGPRPLRRSRAIHPQALAAALSTVMNDRWNTRAWVLQEAFASSGNMILLFPRSKKVNIKGWSLVCHDLSLTEMAVQLDLLHRCFQYSLSFFSGSPHSNPHVKLPNWKDTLTRLRWFYPIQRPSMSFNFWISDSMPRRTCNAAVALSFLKNRDNSRVADRIAIIANLCDYSLRLDTVELEHSQENLSVCIVALALMNGDLSLLLPEVYHMPEKPKWDKSGTSNQPAYDSTHPEVTPQDKDNEDFTWIPADASGLQNLDADILNPDGPNLSRLNLNLFRLSDKGFSFPGFLWKVNEFLDMSSIKEKYSESWFKLRKSATKERDKDAGGLSHYRTRETIRTQWLATTHILFEVLTLLRQQNRIATADVLWHSIMNSHWNRRGGKKEHGSSESVVDFPEELRIENRQGMFELDQGRFQEFYHWWVIDRIMREGGLWLARLVGAPADEESTRFSPEVPKRSHDSAQQETVDVNGITEDLASVGPQVVDFHKDTISEGTVHSSRVDHDVGYDTSKDKEVEAAEVSEQSFANQFTKDSLTGKSDPPGCQAIARSHHREQKQGIHWNPKGQSSKQFVAFMMQKMFKEAITRNDMNYDEDGTEVVTSEAMVQFAIALQDQPSEIDRREKHALFDIQGDLSGDVLVLTPSISDLETIPRPVTRSMGVSWIVEPAPLPEALETMDLNRGKKFRTKGKVRGMWPFMPSSLESYTIL